MKRTAEQKADLVRSGAVQIGRRFVGKFAARVHGDGLGPRAAAEAAIVDLARDGLRALLAPLRPDPPTRGLGPADPRPKSKGRSRPKNARPDPREPGDPLARLKRSIVPGDRTR